MINRTATLTFLLLGLWVMLGALGCSGSNSPIIPGAEDILATADSTTDGDTVAEETRETAVDGSYSGVLTDSDGDPLAWAELYLDGEIAGWTEEDGSFTIYGIDDEAEYNLEAQIDGQVLYTTVITPATRSTQGLGDPDPEIERGTVWGFVHDQLGPVDHALVVIFNNSENFGVDFTDENGYYNIPDAPGGPCAMLGFAPEHKVGHDTVFVIPGGEVQKNMFLYAKLDFGIVGGIVVTGPVGHMKPVQHAKVDLKMMGDPDGEMATTFTNKHGVYRFVPVPLGMAQLWANAPCFNTGHRLEFVNPGRNLVSFHLEPEGCGGVEGKVTDPDGVPVPHALVRLIHPNPDDPGGEPFVKWEFTGPNGNYRFAPVIPGQYGLTCNKPGYGQYVHDGPVPVLPDQFTVINITLTPDDSGPGDPGD